MLENEIRKRKKYSLIAMGIGAFSLMAFLIVLLFSMFSFNSYADTKEDMEKAKQEKEEKEKELAEAEKNLADTQNALTLLESEQGTYQGQMYLLNQEMQLVADNLAVLEAKQALKEMDIEETNALIEENIQLQESQYEAMKTRVAWLYEEGSASLFDLMLSADGLSEFLNYASYVEAINAYDRKQLEDYIATGEAIETEKAELLLQMEELEEIGNELISQQEGVTVMIDATATQIATMAESIAATEAAEAAYMAECDNKKDEVALAESEYETIKAKYEEELRLSELAKLSEKRDISSVTFEEGDEYLLANLIFCEVGAWDYEGQLAVGAVVMNRVLSSRYPNTITGVIYAKYQFSPVLDGHLASALANDKAQANDGSAYKAARAAMAGETNVGNCYYFRTPIEGLEGIHIGGHIYY